MRAIVLAAGEGSRLRPYTADRPKCLVPLVGRTLLDWQILALRDAGITDITIVTGYRSDMVERAGHTIVHNPRYASTNMVVSLFCARDLLDGDDDVVVCYGDLVYESRIVRALMESPAPLAITVDAQWQRLWRVRMADPLADAETLRLDAHGHVLDLGRKPSSLAEIEGQYMGLIGIRREMAPRLAAAFDALDPQTRHEGRDRDHMFMTDFLRHVIAHVSPIAAVRGDGGWIEVDTAADLRRFEALHAAGALEILCRLPEVRRSERADVDALCRQVDVRGTVPADDAESMAGLVAALLLHADAASATDDGWDLKCINSALKVMDLAEVPGRDVWQQWAGELLDRRCGGGAVRP